MPQPDEQELFGNSIDDAIERFLQTESNGDAEEDDSAPDAPDEALQDEAMDFAEEAEQEGEAALEVEPDNEPDEELSQEAEEFASEAVAESRREAGGELEDIALAVEPGEKPGGNVIEIEDEDEYAPEPSDQFDEMMSKFTSMFDERKTEWFSEIEEMIDERIDMSTRRRQL